MNCKNCQHYLPEDSKFCPQCGQEVIQPNSNKSARERTSVSALTKPANAYLMVLAAVVAAIVVVFLILESNQKVLEQKKEISTNTQDNSKEIQVQLEKLNQDPESIPLNTEMGNLFFDSGRFDEAIPFYQKALTLDSKNIAIRIDLGVCFFNLRKIDLAILEMNKALEIDPGHSKGLFNMGIIYYNISDFDKVKEYWQRLISLHPNIAETKKAQEILKSMD
jgi:tetratricopeptide (TPR) repeat protein